MKKIKTIILLFLSAFITLPALSQLKNGDFVYTFFSADKKLYVAEVLTVEGTNFTCRYLHTQSIYNFKSFQKSTSSANEFSAVVESNVGGLYKKGTQVTLSVYRPDYLKEVNSGNFNTYVNKTKNSYGIAPIVARFADGKKYLGSVDAEITDDNPITVVVFWHTNSIYHMNIRDGKVEESGGSYKKGTKVSFFECRNISPDGE